MDSIETYLQALPIEQRKALKHVRQVVLLAVPKSEEVMSYGMPGFKYQGAYLAGYAAFKDHLSFFPTSQPIEVLGDKLSAYKLSKGTVQFTLDNLLTDDLIVELVNSRRLAIEKS
jgi:uncharacterized protein YdhG (YjbR/CyaY superfamily)